MKSTEKRIAKYHLPGLFEFYDLYKIFLPLYYEHREYFYDWCDIASLYGNPKDCLWAGGRVSESSSDPYEVLSLTNKYHLAAHLTFSNSLLKQEHLFDARCNELCKMFSTNDINGVIVHSELLLNYLKENYPSLCLISSTTKVLVNFADFVKELKRREFSYVVPDFRLNKQFSDLKTLSCEQKKKVEFLCNEACFIGCSKRKECYENVSRLNLGMAIIDYHCQSPKAKEGYRFSLAKTNPMFIGIDDIVNTYLPLGFTNFKIEGRSLGSAIVLEFLLYYLTKPEYQLNVREAIYLDSMLDLF